MVSTSTSPTSPKASRPPLATLGPRRIRNCRSSPSSSSTPPTSPRSERSGLPPSIRPRPARRGQRHLRSETAQPCAGLPRSLDTSETERRRQRNRLHVKLAAPSDLAQTRLAAAHRSRWPPSRRVRGPLADRRPRRQRAGDRPRGMKPRAGSIPPHRERRPRTRATSGEHMSILAAGRRHSVACRDDGSVLAAGNGRAGECDVASWSGVIAVAAGNVHSARNTGRSHTIGLRADGTVVATGWDRHGQTEVSTWSEITVVAAGWRTTLGLRRDGTAWPPDAGPRAKSTWARGGMSSR